jgi:YHS domain-containing protein
MLKALPSPRNDGAAACGSSVPRAEWPARSRRTPPSAIEADLCFDPVCEQIVDADTVGHSSVHLGKRYFFCCGNCQSTFERSPARYVHGRSRGPYL